jgi:general secretion pathway protein A
VRLLSNIETNTEKLLQIILVGQPEMGDVLDSYELRQLGQRITLSCHISPLTYKETCQYIHHRIRIAARNEGIPFTKAAFKKIYFYSLGIPRLIHIVCDRALLTAYGLDRHKITGDIVQAAIQELSVRGDVRKLRFIERRKTIYLSALLSAVLVLLFVFKPETIDMKQAMQAVQDFKLQLPEIRKKEIPPPIKIKKETTPDQIAAAPSPPPPPALRFPSIYGQEYSPLVDILRSMNTNDSMTIAITQALSLWELNAPVKHYGKKRIVDDETFFTLTAKENGFLVQKIEGNFDLIKQLDMPAMIGFTIPGNMRPKYLALSAMDDSKLVFLAADPNRRIEMSSEQLAKIWSGIAYIPWKNFFGYQGTTPISGPIESTIILKKMLRNIGYTNLDETSKYDEKTKAAVQKMQSEHGLPADGFVGPLTKIILYSKQPDLSIPHLQSK